MQTTMALPKTTQDRIEQEAKRRGENHMFIPMDGDYSSYKFHGFIVERSYIAGAAAEHNHMQEELKNAQDAAIMFCNKYNAVATQLADTVDRAQNLAEALEQIANSPMPANEQEMYSWIETARMLAIGSLQQWNAGKDADETVYCTCSLQHLAAHGECDSCPGQHTRHKATNPTK